MSSKGAAELIEENVETIKATISHLKKKDEEILDILLKTKMLLDRQKIEDIKLTVSPINILFYKIHIKLLRECYIVNISCSRKMQSLPPYPFSGAANYWFSTS